MGGDRVDLARALVHDGLRGGGERAAGVDHVVDDHGDLALDVTDHAADLGHAVCGALLLHQRVGGADATGEAARQLHAAGVRGDDHEVVGRSSWSLTYWLSIGSAVMWSTGVWA